MDTIKFFITPKGSNSIAKQTDKNLSINAIIVSFLPI